MKIYGLKNCDTCRKALKALAGSELIDVRADRMPEGLLARAEAEFGAAILNTRSSTWRGLSDAERAGDGGGGQSARPACSAMAAAHPTAPAGTTIASTSSRQMSPGRAVGGA